MRKIIAIALAAILLAVGTFAVFASSFLDVPDGAYYADAAERMAERGILDGYGDGCYYGDQHVTRAHIAALACKMLGKVDEALSLAGKTVFNDVIEDEWYTGYINYAVNNGIIIGDGDGNFRPDDYVKYEEVVKVIVCLLGLDKNVKIDPDDWSKEYLEVAADSHLTDKLIGEKGTYMLRSDIAVICDSAMVILDEAAEVTEAVTTTKVGGSTRPSGSGTARPATTTTATTTTAATTTRPAITVVTDDTPSEDELPIIWFD